MVNQFMTAQSTVATRRWGVPAIVTLAAMAALAALTADAAARQARPAPTTEATAPREAGEPIMAIVSIGSQQVTFYDADGSILRAPVSTGTTGRETPAGVFAIIEKQKDHHSTLYDDAWMPNMQRITWNGIALHGGPLPGYAASHGCVRMPYDFAEKLFDKTWIGMRVIISPNDAAPVEFSHRALFVPKAKALAAAAVRAEPLAREAAEATKTADEAKKAAATAAREAASLTASTRSQRARRRGRREGRRQGGRHQEGRPRQGGKRGEARARAGLGLHQPRDAGSSTCGATRISRGRTGAGGSLVSAAFGGVTFAAAAASSFDFGVSRREQCCLACRCRGGFFASSAILAASAASRASGSGGTHRGRAARAFAFGGTNKNQCENSKPALSVPARDDHPRQMQVLSTLSPQSRRASARGATYTRAVARGQRDGHALHVRHPAVDGVGERVEW